MLMTEYNYETDIRVKQEEARQIGENRLTTLISILVKAGRMDDVIRISEDKDYCNQLLNEFVPYNV